MAAIIFISGLLVGSMTSSRKLTDVRELQDSLRSDTLDLEILYAVLEQDPCAYVNTTPLTDQLYDIAVRLDYMEGLLGKTDENVLRLKKYYSLLELRQWMFERHMRDQCNQDKHFILYFYSNEPGSCPQCEEQGFVLSYLRKRFGEKIAIYSFDVSTDSEAVQALIRRYEVETLPSVVIDDELYEGFQSLEALEDLLMSPPPDYVRELLVGGNESPSTS